MKSDYTYTALTTVGGPPPSTSADRCCGMTRRGAATLLLAAAALCCALYVYLGGGEPAASGDGAHKQLWPPPPDEQHLAEVRLRAGKSFERCCVRRHIASKLSKGCVPLCDYGQWKKDVLASAYMSKRCDALRDWAIVFQCAANKRDHRACCTATGMSPGCAQYCDGSVALSQWSALFTYSGLPCMRSLDTIAGCFRDDHFGAAEDSGGDNDNDIKAEASGLLGPERR